MPRTDPDGRMRSTYVPYAITGRYRSSENPLGTGANGQNIDREARDIYVPDTGCVFLGVDLSLAEDRDVKVRTHSERLINQARLLPGEIDFHRQAASKIFRKAQEEIIKDERYIGKRAKHASNYGMQGSKLSGELFKEGHVYSPKECDLFIEIVREPEVLDWQRRVRQEVMQKRTLTSAWGRVVSFEYERLDDDLYRKAYAQNPQSDINDCMVQWGLIPLRQAVRAGMFKVNTNQNGHDSLLNSVLPNEAWEVARFLQANLERELVIDGIGLVIPCEFSLGTDWGNMMEFKQLPNKKDFTEIAYTLMAGGRV